MKGIRFGFHPNTCVGNGAKNPNEPGLHSICSAPHPRMQLLAGSPCTRPSALGAWLGKAGMVDFAVCCGDQVQCRPSPVLHVSTGQHNTHAETQTIARITRVLMRISCMLQYYRETTLLRACGTCMLENTAMPRTRYDIRSQKSPVLASLSSC